MSNKFNSIIYIITHKKIEIDYLDNYIPIQVGKNNTNLNLSYQSDDTGKNISNKNNNYCELTGIYWILHNEVLAEYIGITHYRRFFMNDFYGNKILCDKKITKILKKYDIILPQKFYFTRTVWQNYFQAGAGKENDLLKLQEIIKNEYEEYLLSFNKIMNSNSCSYCNMLVCNKKYFIDYHKWLFEVLGKLEAITDLTGYNKEEARIYGYISEILLNVWVDKHKLKVKHIRVKKMDDTIYKKIKWNIKMFKGIFWNLTNKVFHQ